MPQYRHQELIRFLAAVDKSVPPGKLIHAILDNTPTSGSWINAVEGFFSALTRRRLKRPIERLDCAGLVILLTSPCRRAS